MHKAQKTGNFIKSARVAATVNPTFAAVQPGSLVYASGAALPSVFINQGGDAVPLVPIQCETVSVAPLPLIGNAAVGVFRQLAAPPQTARIEFTTRNIEVAGSVPAQGVVGFSLLGDGPIGVPALGKIIQVVNPAGDQTTGHILTQAISGDFQADILFLTIGIKVLILQYGNESYAVQLNIV